MKYIIYNILFLVAMVAAIAHSLEFEQKLAPSSVEGDVEMERFLKKKGGKKKKNNKKKNQPKAAGGGTKSGGGKQIVTRAGRSGPSGSSGKQNEAWKKDPKRNTPEAKHECRKKGAEADAKNDSWKKLSKLARNSKATKAEKEAARKKWKELKEAKREAKKAAKLARKAKDKVKKKAKRNKKKTKQPKTETAEIIGGQCVADHVCATVRGDPHLTTYDGLKFDCQGHGEFVLAKSMHTAFEIQARFELTGRTDKSVSITKAVSIDTGVVGAPQFDVFVEEVEGVCVLNYYANGTLTDFGEDGKLWDGIDFQADIDVGRDVVDYVYFTGSGVMYTVMAKKGSFGCVMNSKICLPPKMVQEEKIIGLLGTPDGNSGDDFMSAFGTDLKHGGNTGLRDAYDYCTREWCVHNEDDSIFGYEGETKWADYYGCAEAYDPSAEQKVAEASPECVTCCQPLHGKVENEACLLECMEGGEDGATDCKIEIENEETLADVEKKCPDTTPPEERSGGPDPAPPKDGKEFDGNQDCEMLGFDFGWKNDGCGVMDGAFIDMDESTGKDIACDVEDAIGSVKVECSGGKGTSKTATITPSLDAYVILKAGKIGTIYKLAGQTEVELNSGTHNGLNKVQDISHMEFCFNCAVPAPAPGPDSGPEPTPKTVPVCVEKEGTFTMEEILEANAGKHFKPGAEVVIDGVTYTLGTEKCDLLKMVPVCLEHEDGSSTMKKILESQADGLLKPGDEVEILGVTYKLSSICEVETETPQGKSAPPPTNKGGVSGDPHFKTWTGDKYDYHGECDLVLVDHPSFMDGLGLRVHIRTTRVKYFSYIEQVAVQIGEDVLEFNNDVDNFLINGEIPEANRKHHRTYLGGFVVRRDTKSISIRLHDEGRQDLHVAKIDLHARRNGFPHVIVDGGNTEIFKGSLGLLGDWETGKRIARDGETELGGHDATDFALEWQVQDTEPALFQESRFPQYPTTCTPPAARIENRLGSSAFQKEAEEACAHWKEDKEDCIFDVIATRDVLVAEEGHIVHVE